MPEEGLTFFWTLISSVHEAFSLYIKVHAQNIGNKTHLLRKFLKSFDTGIVRKLRKVQYWAKKTFVEKRRVF